MKAASNADILKSLHLGTSQFVHNKDSELELVKLNKFNPIKFIFDKFTSNSMSIPMT